MVGGAPGGVEGSEDPSAQWHKQTAGRDWKRFMKKAESSRTKSDQTEEGFAAEKRATQKPCPNVRISSCPRTTNG